MESFQIKQLLPVLQGEMAAGSPDAVVKHAASSRYHPIKKHTLIFYNPKKNMKLPSKLDTCTIVSSTAAAMKYAKRGAAIVKVKRIAEAYWRFVDYYRSLFSPPVIGVTGTSGKTTVKEMIACMLGDHDRIVKTVLSHNALEMNLRYLVQFDQDTEAAVMEMGVSGPNQLMHSARHFRPEIGIITRIGTDHIEGFGSERAYFEEKIKMLDAVEPGGTIILNADDPKSQEIRVNHFRGRILYFGIKNQADFQAETIDFDHEREGMEFELFHKGRYYPAFVPGFGTHNVYNALAGLAAVTSIGVPIETALRRLQSFKHVRSHLEFKKGRNGCTLIDDTWNTNSVSVEAALEVLRAAYPDRKKVAVIGEIAEMGKYSVSEHDKIGRLIADSRIDFLVTAGKRGYEISESAIKYGMSRDRVIHADSKKTLLRALHKLCKEDTVLLIKTSMRSSYQDVMKWLRKQT